MIPEQMLIDLAEEFDREATANYTLAKRYKYDLELETQYSATARATRHCATRIWSVIGGRVD